MTRAFRQVDHGWFELKWLLRRRLISMIVPETAVDLFAGTGRLLPLTAEFKRVYAVDRDPKKLAVLLSRLSPEDRKRVTAQAGDNRKFVAERLGRIPGINYLDFDAYGNPGVLIERVFRVWRPDRRTAIAVTDAGRLALCFSNRLYGVGVTAGPEGPSPLVRGHPLVRREYELWVRAFWQRLSRLHQFQVRDFTAVWKKGKKVLYYGVLLEPDASPVAPGGGHPAQPLEPEPARRGEI